MSAQQWIESLALMKNSSTEPRPPLQVTREREHQLPFSEHTTGYLMPLPALSEDFTFHTNDLMALEDLDWDFLDAAPMAVS